MVFVNAWQQPMDVKYLLPEGLKEEKNCPFLTKNWTKNNILYLIDRFNPNFTQFCKLKEDNFNLSSFFIFRHSQKIIIPNEKHRL